MKAESAKAKGARLEKTVAKDLEHLGLDCRRQPGSGIYPDFPHDAAFRLNGRWWIVECKSWKEGWRTGDKAKAAADLLVIKPDRDSPRVYMHWEVFLELVGAVLASESQEEARSL